MKKTDIIKKNYEFRKFFKKGKYCSGRLLEFFIFENYTKKNRIGIIVSKKIGKSVVRNKIKRYIRSAYTDIEDSIEKTSNILIIWKKKIDVEKANFFDIKEDMIVCFRKFNILGKEE